MSQERVLSLKKSVSTSPSSDEIGPLHQISTEDSSIHRRCVLDRAQREHKKRMIGPEDAPKGPPELESLDFDAINSPYWVDSARRPPRTLIGYSGDTFVRWLIAILIGFFVACLAKVIAVGVEIFASTRNEILQELLDSEAPDAYAFIFFVTYNTLLVVAGALMTVYLEPGAAAGGIPEIKAYLNGTHVRNFLRLRCIAVKVIGTILSVSSAMACGQEAPMIHIGAGVASGLTLGQKRFREMFSWGKKKVEAKGGKAKGPDGVLDRMHNDRDRREFICAGAGAGMAAAFGAPVGGLLFVLEEASSHWSPALVWRTFTACLVATFTLAFFKANDNGGNISLAGLLSFGTVQSVESMKDSLDTPGGTRMTSAVDAPVYWWEIVFFALVGVGGGILGGLWNLTWNWMFPLRPKTNVGKVIFAVLTCVGTSTLVFTQAYLVPMCSSNGGWTCGDADNGGAWCRGPHDNSTCVGIHATCVNASEWICTGGSSAGKVCYGRGDDCAFHGGKCEPHSSDNPHEQPFGLQLGCQEGEYDELASLYFGVREKALIRLFTQSDPHPPFSLTALCMAGFSYLVLLLFAYGMAIPAGLFMPSVMIGGCLGRIVGELVREYIDPTVFAGAYALAGAAAMLSGVQRATISLVVVIIEGTANVHFLLPMVVTTCVAKFVGNFFGHEGIYEMGIRNKKLKYIEHEPEWEMDLCVAADVMATPLVSFPIVVKISDIVDTLKRCRHNGFPVLSLHDEDAPEPEPEPEEGNNSNAASRAAKEVPYGKFEGTILRAQLRNILSARYQTDGDDPQGLWHRVTAASPDDIQLDGDVEMYDMMATVRRAGREGISDWESTDYQQADLERYVNLGAYMNAASYTVMENCPLTRAFKLFRNLGLRHLPVTDYQNHVVGMLTRASFSPHSLHQVMHEFYSEEEKLQRHDEASTPRLDGHTQVERLRQRKPIQGKTGGCLGGPVITWQSRLLGYLEPADRP